MVANHYRWDFIGLSTDEKPTPATSEKVVDGSTFYCSDNSKLYVFCGNQWYEKTASGGGEPYVLPIASADTLGGIKVGDNLTIDEDGVLSGVGGGSGDIVELTTADYDYPTSNPTGIALWVLPQGIYKFAENVAVWYHNQQGGQATEGGGYAIIGQNTAGTHPVRAIFLVTKNNCYYCLSRRDTGNLVEAHPPLTESKFNVMSSANVANNVTSSYGDYYLPNIVPALNYIHYRYISSGTEVPTQTANAGALYVNYGTTTPELYVQTSTTSTMNWVKVV